MIPVIFQFSPVAIHSAIAGRRDIIESTVRRSLPRPLLEIPMLLPASDSTLLIVDMQGRLMP